MQSNHFIYRSELLLDFLTEDESSQKFKVIADALDREIIAAYNALIAEVADNYGVREKNLFGLRQFNVDMFECRQIDALIADNNSWLSSVLFLFQQQSEIPTEINNVIGSDRSKIVRSRQFYANCIKQITLMAEQFRQQSIDY